MHLDKNIEVTTSESGTEVRRKEEEGVHGASCDCADCDQVDFLHGFVDGEPYGIK
jgi:hypothetical protein